MTSEIPAFPFLIYLEIKENAHSELLIIKTEQHIRKRNDFLIFCSTTFTLEKPLLLTLSSLIIHYCIVLSFIPHCVSSACICRSASVSSISKNRNPSLRSI